MLDKHFPTHNKFNKVLMPRLDANNKSNYYYNQPKPPTQLEKETATAQIKENVDSTKNASLIYEATLTSAKPNLKEKIYFGKAETTFKLR